MKHVYEILLIYALLSQNFIVAIYALFPQIIWGWKVESADFCIFRMYATPPPANIASLNWPTQPNQTNLLFVKLGAIYDREKENVQKK